MGRAPFVYSHSAHGAISHDVRFSFPRDIEFCLYADVLGRHHPCWPVLREVRGIHSTTRYKVCDLRL